MATDKRQFTLRIQDYVFDGVKLIAEKERRSMAVMIEMILEQYMFEYDGFDEKDREQFREIISGSKKTPKK